MYCQRCGKRIESTACPCAFEEQFDEQPPIITYEHDTVVILREILATLNRIELKLLNQS